MIRNNNVSSWAWATCEFPHKPLCSDSMQQQFSLGYHRSLRVISYQTTMAKEQVFTLVSLGDLCNNVFLFIYYRIIILQFSRMDYS